MNKALFTINLWGNEWLISGWKIIGYTGVLMFGGRWIIQVIISSKNRTVTMPRLFWYMSLVGSLFCLIYFLFGKNDSVGVLSYITPSAVAAYNLFLDIKNEKKELEKHHLTTKKPFQIDRKNQLKIVERINAQ